MVALVSLLPPPSSPPPPEPTQGQLGPVRDARKLGEWSLVLKSLGVAHTVSSRDDGWYLLVASGALPRSERAIRDYELENRDWPPRPARRERLVYAGSSVLLLGWAAALAAVFSLSGPVATGSRWFEVGIARADLVARGEVWRAVTALTLHADSAHLVGNLLVGGAFLWVASRRLGAGRALAFTVLGGTLGNLVNALVHAGWLHRPHASLGASTAVFATVGLLVGTQVRNNASLGHRKWTDVAGPWVGGAALLGMLGASPHVDLWAHLDGLLAGVVLGLVAARTPADGARRVWVQRCYAAGALAVVAGAWAIAFALPRG